MVIIVIFIILLVLVLLRHGASVTVNIIQHVSNLPPLD